MEQGFIATGRMRPSMIRPRRWSCEKSAAWQIDAERLHLIRDAMNCQHLCACVRGPRKMGEAGRQQKRLAGLQVLRSLPLDVDHQRAVQYVDDFLRERMHVSWDRIA